MKTFAIGVKSQWETHNLDIFSIGLHKCESCSLFYITLLGFSLEIGLITIEEE